MSIFIAQLLLAIIFLTIVLLQSAKRNLAAVILYGLQSLVIVIFYVSSFIEIGSVSILYIALISLIVKVILAPILFTRLIKKHELIYSVSTYLNTPLTLIGIAALTAIAYSEKLAPLTSIVPENQSLLQLTLAAALLSLFLVVNRKGALSQIIGVLSLENSIVAFALFAGLEQSFSLQVGILFVVLVWLIIVTVFMSMMYRHFGSIDVTTMRHLRD